MASGGCVRGAGSVRIVAYTNNFYDFFDPNFIVAVKHPRHVNLRLSGSTDFLIGCCNFSFNTSKSYDWYI